MKKKLGYVVTIVLCMLCSSLLTIFIINYKLDKVEVDDKEKVVTTVNISENNTIKSSVDKVYDAVVLVETYLDSRKLASGTGFIYKVDDNYGYVMTNHHVIESADIIKITNNDGQTVEATILGSDTYADIAVLRITKDAVMKVAEIGDAKETEIGDTLFAVGSPLGSSYMGTVTKGILSGKDRIVDTGNYRMEVLQTDAAINPGNSGGPLVNINGEVIGVISLKLVRDEIEGMGFAIPIELAMAYAPQLEEGKKIERPVIGVELTDVTSTYGLYLNKIYLDSSIKYGSVIISVEQGYPAEELGLKKGDVIIAIDDAKVEDTSHLRYILYKYEVGDTIKLTIIRDNKELEFNLKLDRAS